MPKTPYNASATINQIDVLEGSDKAFYIPFFRALSAIMASDNSTSVDNLVAATGGELTRSGSSVDLVVVRKRVVRALRQMDGKGLGRYLLGRRGKQTRLGFMKGQREALASALKSRTDAQTEPSEPSATPALSLAGPDTIHHWFVLRTDSLVQLTLPKNFTPHEASRLARFVETLPFGPAAD